MIHIGIRMRFGMCFLAVTGTHMIQMRVYLVHAGLLHEYKDTSVQGSGHTHGCERKSGTREGETDTTTAQVCGAGAESCEKGSKSGCSTRTIMADNCASQ